MRLLLVEDDDRVAAALSAILGKHGFDVRHARNGEEALQALLPGQGPDVDCVLLDLGLPDQDGFEVCSRIRRRTAVPVIMVTARADVRSRIHGLNLGADDYVVKPYDTGELLARIHAVARRPPLRTAAGLAPNGTPTGQDNSRGDAGHAARPGPGAAAVRESAAPPEPAEPLRLGGVVIEPDTRRVTVDGDPVALTRKEFDLLALLAQRPGVVFRREQIISEVWRTAWEGTGRTLEVHVASLRAKLRTPAMIETVRGVGYRLVVPAG
jgi:DNA-binding response OmpR family regulator